jgi:hypothetical protein
MEGGMNSRGLLGIFVCLAIVLPAGACGTDGGGGTPQDEAGGLLAFKIVNQIQASDSICSLFGGESVSIFLPDGSTPTGKQNIPTGTSDTYQLDLSAESGLGIQVNFWFWDQEDHPVQKEGPQNPDHSGAQFKISSSCEITGTAAPYFGDGRRTYEIADVTAAMDGGVCAITIAKNSETCHVTPRCCVPPLDPGWANVCSDDDRGKTADCP